MIMKRKIYSALGVAVVAWLICLDGSPILWTWSAFAVLWAGLGLLTYVAGVLIARVNHWHRQKLTR